MNNKLIIAVVGGHKCNKENEAIAYETGKEIAKQGYLLVCGGLDGIMQAACKGAKESGGITIGILPGSKKSDANDFVDIPIVTDLSHARNYVIVRTADFVIAINGEYGTLSEIALAKSIRKTVFGINTWDIEGVIKVKNPKEAIEKIQSESNKL